MIWNIQWPPSGSVENRDGVVPKIDHCAKMHRGHRNHCGLRVRKKSRNYANNCGKRWNPGQIRVMYVRIYPPPEFVTSCNMYRVENLRELWSHRAYHADGRIYEKNARTSNVFVAKQCFHENLFMVFQTVFEPWTVYHRITWTDTKKTGITRIWWRCQKMQCQKNRRVY